MESLSGLCRWTLALFAAFGLSFCMYGGSECLYWFVVEIYFALKAPPLFLPPFHSSEPFPARQVREIRDRQQTGEVPCLASVYLLSFRLLHILPHQCLTSPNSTLRYRCRGFPPKYRMHLSLQFKPTFTENLLPSLCHGSISPQ